MAINEKSANTIHQAIDLIYETAIDPGKWPELLHALAEFAEHRLKPRGESKGFEEALMLDESPVTTGPPKPQSISLYKALKQLPPADDSLNQKAQTPEYANNEVNQILLGHFKRAIQIAKRLAELEEQHEVVVSLLDHLPIALFVVDEDATILEANHQASRMLAQKKAFRAIEGQLRASLRSDTKKLYQAIHDVLGKGASAKGRVMNQGLALTIDSSVVDARDGQASGPEDLMVFITPVARTSPSARPSVAVFVSSRKLQAVFVPEQTAHFFGLTTKEIAVTSALVQGHSVKKIASDSKVSEHTIRSQVKSILQKTNTRRQTDLVRLMLTGPGVMAPLGEERYEGASSNGSRLIFKGLPVPDMPRFFFLSDGRRMAYREYGEPSGEPLFYCHSLLGSRLELAFEGDLAAKARGIRLIIPDRPGIGCSDARADAGFLEWSEDLKALADYLKIGRFCLAGYAMGGQYALAAAFAMPKRIKHLSLVSVGLRPESAEDFKEMQTFYRFNMKLVQHVPPVYRLFFALMRKGFFHNPDNFFKQFGGQMEGGDLEVLGDPRFRKMLVQNLTEGWRQGAMIPCKDIENWMADSWAFNVEAIQTPVDFWHGERDHHVPSVLGKALAKRLPRAKLFIEADQGHLMFFSHWPNMLDKLRRA